MHLSLSPEVDDMSDAATIVEPLVFYDGNIVLIAGDETVKLHQAVLRRVSSSFECMHHDKDKPSGSIPVIHLSDSSEDLLLYANAIYNVNRYELHCWAILTLYLNSTLSGFGPIAVNVISSLLKMGRKYGTTDLLSDIVNRIRHEFPLSLRNWDVSQSFRGAHIVINGHIVNFVACFRDNNLWSALPALLFLICKTYTVVSQTPSFKLNILRHTRMNFVMAFSSGAVDRH